MMTIPKLRTKSFSYKPWRRAPRLDLSTLLASLPLLLFPVLSPAQSIEEEIPIVPGWNAISIEVDPDDPSPAAVFAGVSVESVWTFLGPRDGEAGAGGRWLVCHVGSPSVVDSLFSIQGGRVYLIRATANGTLRLRGRPLHRERPLHGGRFELTGLPIDAASPPTLGEYLSRASTSESVDAVYELSAGTYRPV
ncbi:MAG TPA: hypothetical protein VK116_00915, partial [Planctomycetota bacterium]|nr:hypothetical protein [Planctomycetota bacterium]